MKALALIDGEHYPEVVRDAFTELEHEVVGAVLLGGTEKLRGEPSYGVPLFPDLETGLEASGAELVLDLSDDPVLDGRRRLRLAARALARGVPYVGADFRFDPVEFAPLDVPALAVIGSGKRVGKTAVTGHVARLLGREREVVVVAMGRGGPLEPVVAEAGPDVEDLLALSRAGAHAASDYLEDATFARVTTVGARRCGGGLAGAPFVSNAAEAARLAASLGPDLVLLEGSGTAIPPVEAQARILVVGAAQDPELVTGYLGAYRILISDLVVLTGCDLRPAEALKKTIGEVKPEIPVIATAFRPAPIHTIQGRRVAFFTTAPASAHADLRTRLERDHGAEVVLLSGHLARRRELRADLETAAARDAELYLVEVKAAAIDVVAETAAERGIAVVLCDNAVQPLPGEPDLDAYVAALADAAVGVPA
ncbi:MAG: 2,3-diphosphoglycerate synthetase [Gaiellales bacterium]